MLKNSNENQQYPLIFEVLERHALSIHRADRQALFLDEMNMNMTRGIRVSFGNGNVKTAVDRGTDRPHLGQAALVSSLSLSASELLQRLRAIRVTFTRRREGGTVGWRVGRGIRQFWRGKRRRNWKRKMATTMAGRRVARTLAHS